MLKQKFFNCENLRHIRVNIYDNVISDEMTDRVYSFFSIFY